ncbi:MAG: cation:proton antiporter [Bdellovibrionales bacterium]|nr:cation:proton antiporter [Bdellovibrionales bacterium]
MHAGSPLFSVFAVLTAALVSATILHRLRQPAVIGFILAGLLIGPQGLGVVPYENVELLSEVGIALLMFSIGVELSIQQLARVRNVALAGALALLAVPLVLFIGLRDVLQFTRAEAIVWAMVTGLSSTVVVLRLLADRGEVGTVQGNVGTGILLVQDMITIPMLVLIPAFAKSGTDGNVILEELLKAGWNIGVIGAGLLVLGRYLVPKLLRFVAHTHSKELFSIAALCLTLGIAGLAGWMGLGLALGAFLAGLIVSESDFGNQASSEVLPLRDAFAAVFFVSIGMLADLRFLAGEWRKILVLLPFLLLIKFATLLAVGFLFRYQAKITVFVALALAQMSEFSFLVLHAARKEGLINDASYQPLLASAILSIVLTPYLLKLHPKIKRLFNSVNKTAWISRAPQSSPEYYEENRVPKENVRGHVIVAGYGPTGSHVARALQDLGLTVVVIDLNYKVVQELKAGKQHAIYGDSSSLIVLEAANLPSAAMLVVTIPDPLAMQSLIQKVKQVRPDITVIMRVKYMSDRDKLLGLGADDIVWEEYEAGRELVSRARERLGIQRD